MEDGLFTRLLKSGRERVSAFLALTGCAAAICWLTTSLIRSGLTDQWIRGFTVFMTATTLGYMTDKGFSAYVANKTKAEGTEGEEK